MIATTDRDAIFREVITEARRERDMQSNMTEAEAAATIRDKFGGSKSDFEVYMRERLVIRLDTILAAAELAPFMLQSSEVVSDGRQ